MTQIGRPPKNQKRISAKHVVSSSFSYDWCDEITSEQAKFFQRAEAIVEEVIMAMLPSTGNYQVLAAVVGMKSLLMQIVAHFYFQGQVARDEHRIKYIEITNEVITQFFKLKATLQGLKEQVHDRLGSYGTQQLANLKADLNNLFDRFESGLAQDLINGTNQVPKCDFIATTDARGTVSSAPSGRRAKELFLSRIFTLINLCVEKCGRKQPAVCIAEMLQSLNVKLHAFCPISWDAMIFSKTQLNKLCNGPLDQNYADRFLSFNITPSK